MYYPRAFVVLLIISICQKSFPQDSILDEKLRRFPLLPNQFIFKDTIYGKRIIDVRNMVNVRALEYKKDSLFSNSMAIAHRVQDAVVGTDWTCYYAIRITYFDKYDEARGYQWVFVLEFPFIRYYECSNRGKLFWLNK